MGSQSEKKKSNVLINMYYTRKVIFFFNGKQLAKIINESSRAFFVWNYRMNLKQNNVDDVRQLFLTHAHKVCYRQ